MAVACSALLVLLVSKLLTKVLGHKELRNAENEKGQSHRDKKPIYTVVSKEEQTETVKGHSNGHQEDYPVIANKVCRVRQVWWPGSASS